MDDNWGGDGYQTIRVLEQARDMFVVRLLLLIDIGASGEVLGCGTMPGAPVADPSISSSFDCFADASASTAPLEGMDGPPSVKEWKRKAVEEG